ncbi:MAG TPA: NF038122 family metalloprotease [Phenylobacterium sp.]|uniref:NF038122 family metalloprotease n=1 Tax=Phenylobacterium sp. TaxID=1871053 RepID=UPI002D132ADF|nr:NF038122 family metalloprotease [Phenylobacterium sp.]HSV03407.1 NF038122 family metalloprotease [Phenylobacterium sp.]
MSLASETVTLAGSGLVFDNSYSANVTDAYRSAIVSAENFFQAHFSNAVTITANFDLAPLASGTAAHNSFFTIRTSYDALVSALRAHATTTDDFVAASGLPGFDPSGGIGFEVATPEARILGLSSLTNGEDVSVTLNSNLSWSFGQDAVGAIEHEISEGAFGRIESLGIQDTRWAPLDLFRFTASGVRDFTGGRDGLITFFGLDGTHLSNLAFHNAVNASGVDDGQDLGDWAFTVGDAFGPGGPGDPGSVSATDLQVLDILGWTPSGSSGASGTANAPTPGDDLLSAQAGFTEIHAGAGDDTITGWAGGDYLRGDDGNDSIQGGSGFDDINGNKGDDVIDGGSGGGDWLVGGQGNDLITAHAGQNILYGNLGNDTLNGGSGGELMRGGQGDDSITGGIGNDWISGDRGSDTITGGAGADVFHSFSGAGLDVVLDFHAWEGDRVQLDPGTMHTESQVGADVVIDMTGGDELILRNVQLSTLPPGWLFTA